MIEKKEIIDYVVNNIEKACSNGWIEAYYQPVIRTLTNRLCGMESLAKTGVQKLTAPGLAHGTSLTLFAIGYEGGYTTKPTTFEYTFQHPDSVKQSKPVRLSPEYEQIRELDLRDFRGSYFPGVCH